MIFAGSLKNSYILSFMDCFLLIHLDLSCPVQGSWERQENYSFVLYIVQNYFQLSCVLQVDKEDLRSYFVKAVNAFFLKNGE